MKRENRDVGKGEFFRAGLNGLVVTIMVGIICEFGQGQIVIVRAGAAFSILVCAGLIIVRHCFHHRSIAFQDRRWFIDYVWLVPLLIKILHGVFHQITEEELCYSSVSRA